MERKGEEGGREKGRERKQEGNKRMVMDRNMHSCIFRIYFFDFFFYFVFVFCVLGLNWSCKLFLIERKWDIMEGWNRKNTEMNNSKL